MVKSRILVVNIRRKGQLDRSDGKRHIHESGECGPRYASPPLLPLPAMRSTRQGGESGNLMKDGYGGLFHEQ